ncbi:MAG: hypothetical protein NT016_01735 [Candidatus Aenigmarchaeota archaeon]|nr:hypothetical protein [Candidatus Aenigmarchaeota archaeon]
MQLTAENLLVLVAAKKGHVCADNQPYFKEKRMLEVARQMQIDKLLVPDRDAPNGKRWFKLTEYGRLFAAAFSMLPSCPQELYLGSFKWDVRKDG